MQLNDNLKQKHTLSKIISGDVFYKILEIQDSKIISRIPNLKIGETVVIVDQRLIGLLKAEVIKLEDKDIVILLPYSKVTNLSKQCYIQISNNKDSILIGEHLKGTILNGFGEVIQASTKDINMNESEYIEKYHLNVPNPLTRPLISTQFLTGIRALDVVIPCGIGQRMLICAQAGVGKTTLINLIAQRALGTIIINLIGERGREVMEFLNELPEVIKNNAIFIIATSDSSNAEKVKSLYIAHAIAAWFRSKGEDVLLIVDSLTRFARALREINMTSGAPLVRGYTSSVFNVLPSILETCGTDINGSITAYYTALYEGETLQNDALIEEIKSITDGHIVLSRKIANSGRYPAIDLLGSISRVYNQITSERHQKIIREIVEIFNRYSEVDLMLKLGEYKSGVNAELDDVIAKYGRANKILNQRATDNSSDINSLLEHMCKEVGIKI